MTKTDSQTGSQSRPHWLLRRADQVTVAVLVLAGLASTVGWWARLIEVERAEPQTARFQVDINQPDWPELVQLPGIGRSLPRRTIHSRQSEGPFQDQDDLAGAPLRANTILEFTSKDLLEAVA